MPKPKVFIGSSKKGLSLANEIQQNLGGDDADVVVWNQGVFELGEVTIESLVRALEEFDFAIFVFTPDDLIVNLKAETFSPRDNVLFEAGLFMGRLGRFRTYIVVDFEENVKIATDFAGITFATYKQGQAIPGQASARLASACTQIRNKISELGSFTKKEKELGALYRILNAFAWPRYRNIKNDFLSLVNFRDPERFDDVADVVDFLADLLSDYIGPLLTRQQLEALRIYFAYYLGDGVRVPDTDKVVTCCVDVDNSGQPFDGQFVIGLSNPTGFSQKSWRVGRAISGYKGSAPTSNCAKVFKSGVSNYKSDLSSEAERAEDYETEEELSIYTVPVEWRSSEGNARIGVLAVSSRFPNFISDQLQVRLELLGNIVGFLFSLHAIKHLKDLDAKAAKELTGEFQLTGFDIETADDSSAKQFAKRAVALRMHLSEHFEQGFARGKRHAWRGDALRVDNTPEVRR